MSKDMNCSVTLTGDQWATVVVAMIDASDRRPELRDLRDAIDMQVRQAYLEEDQRHGEA